MASLAKNFILIGALNTNYHTQAFGLMGFQRPATLIMEKIVDLHHDIFSVLLFLTILVVYLLTVNIFKYSATRIKTKRNFFFRSCAVLEIAWTTIPLIIIISMIFPSFALLYAMDHFEDPALSLKIIGHQWYWSFELNVLENKVNILKNKETLTNIKKDNYINLKTKSFLQEFTEKKKIDFINELTLVLSTNNQTEEHHNI